MKLKKQVYSRKLTINKKPFIISIETAKIIEFKINFSPSFLIINNFEKLNKLPNKKQKNRLML